MRLREAYRSGCHESQLFLPACRDDVYVVLSSCNECDVGVHGDRAFQPAVQPDDAPAEKLLARRPRWIMCLRVAGITSAYLHHQHVAVLSVLASSSRKLHVRQISSTYDEVHMHALTHVWRA